MLIPNLTLTPGLAERLRACGDEPLDVMALDPHDDTGERCHRCGGIITAEAAATGWPVPRLSDALRVCPDCYGDGAYCGAGHLLRGDTDSSHCPQCDDEAPPTCLRVLHADGSRLAEHERIRVEGVVAAQAV